ncbi:V-type ATP synthase subunit I [Clostridium amazonitimonense]|uniref:V-type ATP synthase subunit I n=1 Tax=Clostridium amazonitimonense TaxID=1499689 RepID=UPI0005A942F2|nr:V-type ATPase 116kDa subunit family protein [Clostridium amazonitimonense]
MSVEKMYMVNLIGAFSDFEKLTKSLALDGYIHPVNALQEINSSDFALKTSEDNIEALMDVSYIRPYSYDRDFNLSLKHLERLKEERNNFNIAKEDVKEVIYDYNLIEKELDEVYSKFQILYKEYEELKDKAQYIKNTYEAFEFLKDVSVPLEDITSMKNFKVGLYKVSQENMKKIKANYENIPSVVTSVYKEKDFVIFTAFTPKILINESERIFKSANCEELLLPYQYKGTPKEVVKKLSIEKENTMTDIALIEDKLKEFLNNNSKRISILENSYELEQKSSEIKKTAACTNEFFYLSGWVPSTYIEKIEGLLSSFEERIILIKKTPKEINNKAIIPPTKLNNKKLFKPFESMVGMYGIPSYSEIDPTLFLAITYTIMFGAMFGDVGQGAVLLLAGLFLKHKQKRVNLGGILSRLGVSSMVFGFLYGSIFGFEDLIDALLIRPMEDINDILIWAIVFGCGFLVLGFILGIINSLKRKDIEHGLFGKDGLAGFLFYLGVLTLVLTKLMKKDVLPMGVWIVFLIFCLVLILLKQPLANMIIGKKPLFEDGAKDYFIEASFEVIETLLSMFSNTVSFIRVGAFALNHVGLFVAFSAMAEMTKNGVGSVLILILGNIIIIGLEGLIVFIQGLRLQYYELFSKYYEGSGIPFEPIKVNFN